MGEGFIMNPKYTLQIDHIEGLLLESVGLLAATRHMVCAQSTKTAQGHQKLCATSRVREHFFLNSCDAHVCDVPLRCVRAHARAEQGFDRVDFTKHALSVHPVSRV